MLRGRISKLTKGKNGQDLEATIIETERSIQDTKKNISEISNFIYNLDKRVKTSARNIQLIRFKAFENGGSNQSFSMSLLDEKGNGAVLTAIHTRDRVSTFAKPISGYTSTFELTNEERSVIDEAKRSQQLLV